ncbi:MAG: hypothetical protein HFF61_11265 [Oscillospiraceae bacterium]|nr:hypothetical protein [Oscillospiraceae bacterium]
MRRLWIALFAALCAVAMTACGAGNVPQGDVPAEEDREKGTVSGETAPEEERSWTEQDLLELFRGMQAADTLVYLDCALMSDRAEDRIGAVLFENREEGTTNVAFFDAEGHASRCGVRARAAEDPGFAYLGEGAAAFRADTEAGVCAFTITISIDGSTVSFDVASELAEA